jgi:hypothetical protein
MSEYVQPYLHQFSNVTIISPELIRPLADAIVQVAPGLDQGCVNDLLKDFLRAAAASVNDSNFLASLITRMPQVLSDFIVCHTGKDEALAVGPASLCVLEFACNLLVGMPLDKAALAMIGCLHSLVQPKAPPAPPAPPVVDLTKPQFRIVSRC